MQRQSEIERNTKTESMQHRKEINKKKEESGLASYAIVRLLGKKALGERPRKRCLFF